MLNGYITLATTEVGINSSPFSEKRKLRLREIRQLVQHLKTEESSLDPTQRPIPCPLHTNGIPSRRTEFSGKLTFERDLIS